MTTKLYSRVLQKLPPLFPLTVPRMCHTVTDMPTCRDGAHSQFSRFESPGLTYIGENDAPGGIEPGTYGLVVIKSNALTILPLTYPGGSQAIGQ